jgi:hypothetical protein|tara:strand:+ start:2081 stop:3442 length:1362 start_codon:yes stop_codon:yes gene_type:complete
MAITLRNTKGVQLSHYELDTNFTELYYSSSIVDHKLTLHALATSSFLGKTDVIEINTGSTLPLISNNIPNTITTISGSLVVTDTLTVQELHTEVTSASVIFESGSTKFGDTQDDNHAFTGSVQVSGSAKLGSNAAAAHTVTGSFGVKGDVIVDGTGKFEATGSQAFRVAAGYMVLNEVSSSLNYPHGSASLADGVPLGGVFRNGNFLQIATDAVSKNVLTGSIDLNGAITASGGIFGYSDLVSSSAQIAAHGFATTSSLQEVLDVTGSYATTSSVNNITNLTGSYATTGSNIFSGSQNITGSLQLTGSADLTGLLTVTGTGTSQFSSHLQSHCLGIGTTPSGIAGEIRATGDITAYYSSDERLKDNITPIENPVDKLKQIKGVEFDWIQKEGVHSYEGHDVGVIAQDIEKVLPEVVVTRDNGYKAVKYEKLVSLLIQANKELIERIERLEAKG